MSDTEPGVSKEIPAQYETLEKVGEELRRVNGREFWAEYRVAGSEDPTRLRIMNDRVAPWRRDSQPGLGRNYSLIVTQNSTVLDPHSMQSASEITESHYRYGIRRRLGRPVLDLQCLEPFSYLEDSEDGLVVDWEAYAPATELQAQELLDILGRTSPKDRYSHIGASDTVSSLRSTEQLRGEITSEVSRVLRVAADLVTPEDNHLLLPFDGKQMRLVADNDDITIIFEEIQTDQPENPKTIRASYTLMDGNPLYYNTSFSSYNGERDHEPMSRATVEQQSYLLGALKYFSKDKIQEYLRMRQDLRDEIRHILETPTFQDPDLAPGTAADIDIEGNEVHLAHTQNGAYTVSFDNDTTDSTMAEAERAIRRQVFYVPERRPITTSIVRYGQESRPLTAQALSEQEIVALTSVVRELPGRAIM